MDAFSTQVQVLPGVPVHIVNTTCPLTAVANSSVTCTFVPVDAFGNVATLDMLTQVQTLVSSVANGMTLKAQNVPVQYVLAHDGAAFTMSYKVKSTGAIAVAVTTNSVESFAQTITQFAPTIDPFFSSISCVGTMTAGTSAACTLVGRNGDSVLTGAAPSAPAWEIVLTSTAHGAVRMSTHYQSTGMYTASAAILKAGAWSVHGTFAGRRVAVDATDGGSTIVVKSGAISALTTTVECPLTAPSNAQISCVVRAKDAWGNLGGKESMKESIDVVAILPSGAPMLMETVFYSASGGSSAGVFEVNFTVPSGLMNGAVVQVRGFYLSQPMFSLMGVDVDGGPTSSTSFVVQPDPPVPPPVCVTLVKLVEACVEHRGKWGFTCGQRDWKRSGGCGAGELFDVVTKVCRSECSA